MSKQLIVLIAVVALLIINSIFIEPNSLEVVKYEIENNYLQGAKIVYISDFHLKRGDYKRLDRIVDKVNMLEPDIVLLGGDYASGKSLDKTMNPEIMAQKLSLINSATYAVLGETDWAVGGKQIINALFDSGIRVLEDSNVRIVVKGKYLDIIGVSDYIARSPNLAQAIGRTGMPRILFTHNPDIYYDIADEVTLIFAGHTHGGQFIIPFGDPLFTPSKYGSELARGLVKNTINKMIVSKGLGTSVLPIRVNCRPEITYVKFVPVSNEIDPYEDPAHQPLIKKKKRPHP